MALAVKAKLEAVEVGIATFEDEFHVYESGMGSQLEKAYSSDRMPFCCRPLESGFVIIYIVMWGYKTDDEPIVAYRTKERAEREAQRRQDEETRSGEYWVAEVQVDLEDDGEGRAG